MDKKEVSAFFDSLADSWDSGMVKYQWKIDKILGVAEVMQGKTVLDVACGTGVLISDYLSRNVKKCVAVDISERMVEIAKNKFSQYDNVDFLCADAEETADRNFKQTTFIRDGGENLENKNYLGLHRVQTEKLQHN